MTNFRSFGIELECYHPTKDADTSTREIIAAIRAMGYRAKASNYTGRDYDHWQVKPDGSVSPYGRSLELVAPTLPGTPASFEQVRKVVEWMSAQGFDVNKSCGFHVHIGTPDLSIPQHAAVAYRYHLLRDDINAVLPRSRHNGNYCEALAYGALDKVRRGANGANTLRWDHGERRVAVNLEHSTKDRSARRIEFRQHSGTLNWGKVFGWYRLMCEFIEETVRLYGNGPTVAASVVQTQPNVGFPPVGGVRQGRTRRVTGNVATVSRVVGTTPAGVVPYIEPNSDYDKFLNAIETHGVVTMADGRAFGWPDTRLRVTAHWLRQRGAALVTTERNGELAYVGQSGARTRSSIFTESGVVRERVAVSNAEALVRAMTAGAAPGVVATVTRPAVASPATVDERLNAPFTQGLSAETLAWYRQRREDFGNT